MFLRPVDIVDVALGLKPADLAILNGQLVNVNTREIQKDVSVFIKGKWVAYVGIGDQKSRIDNSTEVIDAKGKYLVPGFIDAHTHLAGQYINPYEFIRYVMPTGTTTLVTEVLEPYMIGGIDGLKELIDFFSNQPLKVFFLAPINISISPNIKDIPQEDLDFLLKRDDVLGIGESYWQKVIARKEYYINLFNKASVARKTLEGHSAGAKGDKLVSYTCFGISSCHEPIRIEEVLERLRLGMYVMIREGGVREDLLEMRSLKDMKIDRRKLILVTDSIAPDFLLKYGYLDRVVQKAIDMGFDPVEAIQMVTINPAQHFGLEDVMGSISPGKHADILILDDLKEIKPIYVISNGKILVKDKEIVVKPLDVEFSEKIKKSIFCKPKFTSDDFKVLSPKKQKCKIRVMEFITELVTRETVVEMDIVNGEIVSDPQRDIVKVCALERTGKEMFLGFVKGVGLKRGAVCCSSCWDTLDIVVAGVNDEDMSISLNRVIQLQGGVVVSVDGEIVELPLPLYGLLPEISLKETVKKMEEVKEVLLKSGFKFKRPWLVLSILTCTAIPFFRMCEKGYVNFKENKLKGLFLD